MIPDWQKPIFDQETHAWKSCNGLKHASIFLKLHHCVAVRGFSDQTSTSVCQISLVNASVCGTLYYKILIFTSSHPSKNQPTLASKLCQLVGLSQRCFLRFPTPARAHYTTKVASWTEKGNNRWSTNNMKSMHAICLLWSSLRAFF